MKWFSYIFAAYIFVLSFAPCGDHYDCGEQHNHEMAVEIHTNHEHEIETCSPFCVCNCCSVLVTPGQVTIFSLVVSSPPKPVSPFTLAAVTKIPLPIWQPPQAA